MCTEIVYLNDRFIKLFNQIEFQINRGSFYRYNLIVYF